MQLVGTAHRIVASLCRSFLVRACLRACSIGGTRRASAQGQGIVTWGEAVAADVDVDE